MITLRPATLADANLLREWANDPAVRAASFETGPIDEPTHRRWLEQKLDGGTCGFYIAIADGGGAAGYARVDIDGAAGELAVSVDAALRGRGYGRQIIAAAAARAADEFGLSEIRARVKHDNTASLRAFAAAGFTPNTDTLVWKPPAATPIPHSRADLAEPMRHALNELLVGTNPPGTMAWRLEQRWCGLTGMAAAAAVGSGLAALRLALLALGVRPGDEVIVPAYSCVALLNAPLAVGATPVLADVLPDTWTIDPNSVAQKLSDDTTAIIAVNLFGCPADTATLSQLGVPIIEDCAHGPLLGRTDINISSFYATKLVGAGMGGIVAAHNPELIERVRGHRDYGDRLPDSSNLNDRLADILAATADEQLSRLDANLEIREDIADRYAQLLLDHHLAHHSQTKAEDRVWYRFAAKLPDGYTAALVVERMKAAGVNAEQPVWDLRGCRWWRDDLHTAAEAFDRVISLPLYPGLTLTEQVRVVDTLEAALR
jgi:dTDP-4-amino-4,6-dideoxygalactose transaminase/RimJ/RimL family protein N-acetyltransferase